MLLKSLALTAEFDVGCDEWDRIASGFLDVTYEQTAAYNKALGIKSSNIVLRRNRISIAGACLRLYSVPLAGGIAYCRGGPFWRRVSEAADLANLSAILQAMVAEYCGRRGYLLTVLPVATPEFYDAQCARLANEGFVIRRSVLMPHQYFVSVAETEADRRSSLSTKWRYNLTVSKRSDIRFQFSQPVTDDRSGDVFMEMHKAMVARKYLTNFDRLDVLPALARLPQTMRPYTVIASHQGRPICGAVVAMLGDTAYYVYGASVDESLPIRGSYGLHWAIMNWLAEQGVQRYNLGMDAHDPGLRQFKTGMVGKTGRILEQRGEFDYWCSMCSRITGDALYRLRSIRRGVPAKRRILNSLRHPWNIVTTREVWYT